MNLDAGVEPDVWKIGRQIADNYIRWVNVFKEAEGQR